MKNKNNIFPESKKALSTVVTTLMIIVLVLVAIAVIWAVVNNVLKKGTGDIDLNAKCLNADLKFENVTLIPDPRGIGIIVLSNSRGETVDGFLINLYPTLPVGGGSMLITNDTLRQIKPFEGTTVFIDLPGTTIISKVELYPYFLDANGEKFACPITDTYVFDLTP